VKVAIGSDHRGFRAKSSVKTALELLGHEVLDLGSDDGRSCDYPDLAFPTAQAVVSGDAERGILMCGTGIGMSIAANKTKGVRAALCHDELTARLSRQHQDANVLCLPADLVGEELIRRIVEVWLETPFEEGRHARRVAKITEREQGC
jgi:ribose 5-phosphate isomerase B